MLNSFFDYFVTAAQTKYFCSSVNPWYPNRLRVRTAWSVTHLNKKSLLSKQRSRIVSWFRGEMRLFSLPIHNTFLPKMTSAVFFGKCRCRKSGCKCYPSTPRPLITSRILLRAISLDYELDFVCAFDCVCICADGQIHPSHRSLLLFAKIRLRTQYVASGIKS